MVLPRWLKGKKMLNELHKDIVNWVRDHENVVQSPIYVDVVKLLNPAKPWRENGGRMSSFGHIRTRPPQYACGLKSWFERCL